MTLDFIGNVVNILLVSLVTSINMMSDNDDYSLSGLTQEDPEYRNVQCSSDEDNIDNLHALFESARKLAGGEIKDFGKVVFNLNQVEKPSNVTSSTISVGTEDFQNVSKVLTYSGSNDKKDIEVGFEFIRCVQMG